MNNLTLFAKEISQAVNMKEALSFYGYEVNRSGYAACPFHNERTASLKVYDDHFYCYGCGANGDIVEFVRRLYNLEFDAAINKINDDFLLRLPLDGNKLTPAEQAEINRRARELKEKMEAEERKRIENSNRYFSLLDEYIKYENYLAKYRPAQYVETLHPLFVEALHNIDRVGYLLDTFDREGGYCS